MPEVVIEDPTLDEFLKNSKSIFLVPAYQRPYTWNNSIYSQEKSGLYRNHVDEFWNDIITSYRNAESSEYYLGSIVTAPSQTQPGRRDVIDGQQRLITIYILLSAIRDWYYKQTNEDIKEKGKEIHKDFLHYTDDTTTTPIPRIILGTFQENDEDFKKILNNNILNREINDKSLVLSAYKYFSNSIDKYIAQNETGDSDWVYLGKFFKYFKNKIRIAHVDAGDALAAHTVFEVLNNRGIPLSEEDKIKNYVLSSAGTQSSIAEKLWGNVNKNLIEGNESNFCNFLTYYLTSVDGKIYKEEELYPKIREYISADENKAISFVKILDSASYKYAAITNPTHPYWETICYQPNKKTGMYEYWDEKGKYPKKLRYRDKKRIMQTIDLLKILKDIEGIGWENYYPIIIAVLDYFEGNAYLGCSSCSNNKLPLHELHAFIEKLEIFILRDHFSTSRRSKSAYSKVSKNIRKLSGKGLTKTSNDIFNDYSFRYRMDESRTDSFVTNVLTIDFKDSEEILAKYILTRIEKELRRARNHVNKNSSDREYIMIPEDDINIKYDEAIDYESATLEHILPIHADKDSWQEFFRTTSSGTVKELGKTYISKIYNMSLLSNLENIEAGNKPWEYKSKIYKKSTYVTSKLIWHWENWDIESLNLRKSRMKYILETIWSDPLDDSIWNSKKNIKNETLKKLYAQYSGMNEESLY
jgi:possible type I restriction-modification system protein